MPVKASQYAGSSPRILHQLLLPGSCPDFLQWWRAMLKYKPNKKPFPSQIALWSWHFIAAIDTPRQTSCSSWLKIHHLPVSAYQHLVLKNKNKQKKCFWDHLKLLKFQSFYSAIKTRKYKSRRKYQYNELYLYLFLNVFTPVYDNIHLFIGYSTFLHLCVQVPLENNVAFV